LTRLSAVTLCPSNLNKGGCSLIERSEGSTSLDLEIVAHLTSPNNAVATSLENNKLIKILFI
tara:strand:+ start:196 stop:381 length:186 start_codon:yes stop_codon:yes gene_type:complete